MIYLDPPFNSNASYNVLFNAPSGEQSQAQIEAFDDTWHWNQSAEQAFDEVLTGSHAEAAIMLKAMRVALGGVRCFWKIDSYDRATEIASPDPADPAVTTRVLTIMRADEY